MMDGAKAATEKVENTINFFCLIWNSGVISMCGHTPTENVLWSRNKNMYLDEYKNSIWRNERENVYLLDCGCGFKSGRLACICLETGEILFLL